MVRALATQGAEVQIVSVASTGGGTAEDPADTAAAFEDLEVDVVEVEAATVADGLVEAAAADGGILVIGASRDRRLSQWVLGSTPDRVIERAEEAEIPVLVYATPGVFLDGSRTICSLSIATCGPACGDAIRPSSGRAESTRHHGVHRRG